MADLSVESQIFLNQHKLVLDNKPGDITTVDQDSDVVKKHCCNPANCLKRVTIMTIIDHWNQRSKLLLWKVCQWINLIYKSLFVLDKNSLA